MSDAATALVVTAAIVTVLMVLVWIVSVALRDASIVDPIWGLGFVLVAWGVRSAVDGNVPSVSSTVTFLPVRSSMIVIVSATWLTFPFGCSRRG